MSHRTISFIKSGVRIVGYILLPLFWYSRAGNPYLVCAAGTLVVSELIGIWEEVGSNGQ